MRKFICPECDRKSEGDPEVVMKICNCGCEMDEIEEENVREIPNGYEIGFQLPNGEVLSLDETMNAILEKIDKKL